jgi:hypothetical protein
MRRWSIVGALILALVVAAGITLGFPRLSLTRFAVVACVVCIAPGALALLGRRDRVGVAASIAGVLAAPIVIATSWSIAHPVLHVDDATDRPMQIWIDDEPLVIVAPTPERGEPTRVRVAWGRRRFGWSEVGARAPQDAIDAHVDVTGAYLYSPAAAGCYWIEATSYGDASLRDVPRGPQRVQQLLRFDRVDVWFDVNPATLHRSLLRRGDVSIAVQRYGQCMQLARAGCDVDARRDFVECMTTLHGPSPDGDCYEKAFSACKAAIGAEKKK